MGANSSRALLLEESEVVPSDLPHGLVLVLPKVLINLDRLTHNAEDEGEDDLGTARARHVYIHHHDRVLLENVILLVDQPQGVEDHQGCLYARSQDDQGPVEAHHRAILARLTIRQALDAVTDAAHGHSKDSKRDQSAKSVQPNRNLELPEDAPEVSMLLLVEGDGVEDSGPDGDEDVGDGADDKGC